MGSAEPPAESPSAFEQAVAAVTAGASPNEAAAVLVADMTLDERLGCLDGDLPFWPGLFDMTSGGYYRHTFPAGEVRRLGVPGIRFADGPRGCVVGAATAFPVSMARGATFDPELEERVGEAIGAELRARGANFTGAVCLNLLRHPGWGRAQETYGEDPLHVGTMAAALTRGLQRHVIACMKHFALNSMENARFTVDVRADERALHEVYLPHFKMVTDAGAGSVMSAYNSVNGAWCGENRSLLREILRDDWGFDGFVISDFIFGVRDAVASVKAGLDIEMPFRMRRAMALADALAGGELTEAEVDSSVTRIMATLLRFAWQQALPASVDRVGSAAHRTLATEVATRSMVLFRNAPWEGGEPLLPVAVEAVRRIAVVGRLARVRNLGDGGSSDVHPDRVVTPLDGIRTAFADAAVHHDDGTDLAAVAASDLAIVVVGYTKADEGEYIDDAGTAALIEGLFPAMDHPELGVGAALDLPEQHLYTDDPSADPAGATPRSAMAPGGDRRSLRLSVADEALIAAVVARQPRTVVVVMGGSAVVMPWADSVPAILQIWYPGLEGGTALGEVLCGRAEPGGRLAFAVPVDEADLVEFDPDATSVEYGLLHGQWHLDHHGTAAHFPFGHGLGYTSFRLGDATTNGDIASVEVTNVGRRRGSTVIFAFAGLPTSAWERPRRRLVGFQRVSLDGGATTRVPVLLDWSMLRIRQNGGWVDEPGDYCVDLAQHAGDPTGVSLIVAR